jgi:hypothetical protein
MAGPHRVVTDRRDADWGVPQRRPEPFERDGGAIGKEDTMTVISDTIQTWPDAVVDIGPLELADHFWGIVGSIPYDGHVVLAVIGSDPNRRALHP